MPERHAPARLPSGLLRRGRVRRQLLRFDVHHGQRKHHVGGERDHPPRTRGWPLGHADAVHRGPRPHDGPRPRSARRGAGDVLGADRVRRADLVRTDDDLGRGDALREPRGTGPRAARDALVPRRGIDHRVRSVLSDLQPRGHGRDRRHRIPHARRCVGHAHLHRGRRPAHHHPGQRRERRGGDRRLGDRHVSKRCADRRRALDVP